MLSYVAAVYYNSLQLQKGKKEKYVSKFQPRVLLNITATTAAAAAALVGRGSSIPSCLQQ